MAEKSGSASHDPLFAEEYRTLREESGQARQAQQTILQWSLGAFALLFAASFALTDHLGVYRFLYGWVLPGLIIFSTMAWFGELIRMERVGYYLRGRERDTWPAGLVEALHGESGQQETIHQAALAQRAVREAPLLWENFIAFIGTGMGRQKQRVGYLGSLLIYSGALFASIALSVGSLRADPFSKMASPFAPSTGLYANGEASHGTPLLSRLGRQPLRIVLGHLAPGGAPLATSETRTAARSPGCF